MDYVKGLEEIRTLEISDVLSDDWIGKEIIIKGAVHTIRDMSQFSFIILRNYQGLIQCVPEEGKVQDFQVNDVREGATVEVKGILSAEDRAPNGFEVRVTDIRILSVPAKDAIMPLPISKWKLNTSLESKLSLRPISLRNIRERAIFKIQEGIVRAFRDFLFTQHFTEIRTPKIVAGNAEGGANVFKLEYFGKKAFLAQSPNILVWILRWDILMDLKMS